MNKETLRMQKLAGIITEEQYQTKINEEIDIPSEIDQYLTDNPITHDNQHSGEFTNGIHQLLIDKLGRPLTPKEKSSITRIYSKYLDKYWKFKFYEKRNKENENLKNRYIKNLLPLTKDNGSGTPDPTYYEPANRYRKTDRDGNLLGISHRDQKSGYTDYILKDKWVNTPVEDSIMDKFWEDSTIKHLNI